MTKIKSETWTYDSSQTIKSTVQLTEEANRTDYLSSELHIGTKVHVFIAKGFFSYIKYFILWLFSSNWKEVSLHKKAVGGSFRTIKVLVELQEVEKKINAPLKEIFKFNVSNPVADGMATKIETYFSQNKLVWEQEDVLSDAFHEEFAKKLISTAASIKSKEENLKREDEALIDEECVDVFYVDYNKQFNKKMQELKIFDLKDRRRILKEEFHRIIEKLQKETAVVKYLQTKIKWLDI